MYGMPQKIEVSKNSRGWWKASLVTGPRDEQWIDNLTAGGPTREAAVGRLKGDICKLIANQWLAGCRVVDRKAVDAA